MAANSTEEGLLSGLIDSRCGNPTSNTTTHFSVSPRTPKERVIEALLLWETSGGNVGQHFDARDATFCEPRLRNLDSVLLTVDTRTLLALRAAKELAHQSWHIRAKLQPFHITTT
jgi:hypothetical protein